MKIITGSLNGPLIRIFREMNNLYNESNLDRILIVDDDPGIRLLFEKAMQRAGYDCHVSASALDAMDLMSALEFDVVITDIDMPGMTGIELAEQILDFYTADVIIMTGKVKSYNYNDMIKIGASDFVEKPFSLEELILRINRVLRERRLRKDSEKSHEELKKAYLDSIHRLVMASEFKDEYTGDHIVRIGEYSRLIAVKLGLSENLIENIYLAAPMHDVGKIGIPDKILLKPGELDEEEFIKMQEHSAIGAKILSRSSSDVLKTAKEIAISHHEKYDGSGYPNRLSGDEIPLSGRIVTIVDVFDALMSRRPYKAPYPPDLVLDMIEKEKGRHFDPLITDVFVSSFEEFITIREAIGPEELVPEPVHFSERDKNSLQS